MLLCALMASAGGEAARGVEVLVGEWGTSTVYKVDTETGVVIPFISGPELLRPMGLLFAPDGTLYVSSWGNDSIIRYDGQTGELIDVMVQSFTVPEEQRLMRPEHLYLADDGILYVQTSAQRCGVVRFDTATGDYLGRFINPNDTIPFFYYVEGMAVDDAGDFFLAGRNIGEVHRFDGETGAWEGLVALGNDPEGCTIGPDGNLYVSEYLSDQVSSWPIGGGLPSLFYGGVNGVFDVDFGHDGNGYVVGYLSGLMYQVDAATGQLQNFYSVIPSAEPMTVLVVPESIGGSPGDMDVDGDVDLVDFASFQVCFTGSAGSADAGCGPVDFDNDGDVDLTDFAEFQLAFTGAL
jgi:sugar lactone lactonase YvrE